MSTTKLRRWVPIAGGLLAIAAYLGGAAVTARLDPLGSRPLLDGLAPPPPYHWVDPPPDLAEANQRPSSAEARVPLGPTGSAAQVVSPSDLQATLVLPETVFPPSEPDNAVVVTIEPLAASGFGSLPEPFSAQGNVYRIVATYDPSGTEISALADATSLIMVYPALPNQISSDVSIFLSSDGREWEETDTAVAPLQHQAQADVEQLGYFVVGSRSQPQSSAPPPSAGWSTGVLRIVLVALIAIAFGVGAWLLTGRWAARRAGREEADWKDE